MRFPIFTLARKSLMNRKVSVMLTILSLALSVLLFAGVEKIRQGVRTGFETTISGTDLVVGPRTGQVNLLLYTVFRIGEGMPAISWESYELISSSQVVEWSIPIALGDSHRGFRVVGTTNQYFQHYKFGQQQNLSFAQGGEFSDETDVVIGATVARSLGYTLGDKIRIAHGLVATSFAEHDEADFTIVGILNSTGTPVDASVHVTLEGLELVHEDDAEHTDHAHEGEHAHQPEKISAFLLGLKSRPLALQMQGQINNYEGEPLTAILPGVTLGQLWAMIGNVEKALLAITFFVIVVGLIGMLIRILASLNERRREMAILRALGARPGHVFQLLVVETMLSAFLGALLGLGLLYGGFAIANTVLGDTAAIPAFAAITAQRPSGFDLMVILSVTTLAGLLSVFPAWKAFRDALHDGLTIRT